jgi:hypothetical protein
MRNLFRSHQQGMRLQDMIGLCKAQNKIPDLLSFLTDAREAGWSRERVFLTVVDALRVNEELTPDLLALLYKTLVFMMPNRIRLTANLGR